MIINCLFYRNVIKNKIPHATDSAKVFKLKYNNYSVSKKSANGLIASKNDTMTIIDFYVILTTSKHYDRFNSTS